MWLSERIALHSGERALSQSPEEEYAWYVWGTAVDKADKGRMLSKGRAVQNEIGKASRDQPKLGLEAAVNFHIFL